MPGGAKIIVIPLTTCPTFTQFPAHVTHGRVSSTYGGVLIRYTCTSGCMDYYMSVGPYLMAKKRRHEKRIPKLKSLKSTSGLFAIKISVSPVSLYIKNSCE